MAHFDIARRACTFAIAPAASIAVAVAVATCPIGIAQAAPSARCSSHDARRPDIAKTAWTVSVDATTGGAASLGTGKVTVLSDRRIWADGCLARLSPAEFAPIRAAVRSAGDDRWDAEYKEPQTFCCDMATVTMSVDRLAHGRDVYRQIESFTADDPKLPRGFTRLYAAVENAAAPYAR